MALVIQEQPKDSTQGMVLRGAVRELWGYKGAEAMVAGPAETGKTIGCLLKVHALMLKYKGCQGMIIRQTYQSMGSTVLSSFERKVLGPLLGTVVKAYGGAKPQWYDYPGNGRLWIGGMDTPERILSGERDFAYVNQCEELSLHDWEILLTRCTGRAGNMPYSQVFGDCNPGPPTHWIINRPTLKVFHSRHEDNPVLFEEIEGGEASSTTADEAAANGREDSAIHAPSVSDALRSSRSSLFPAEPTPPTTPIDLDNPQDEDLIRLINLTELGPDVITADDPEPNTPVATHDLPSDFSPEGRLGEARVGMSTATHSDSGSYSSEYEPGQVSDGYVPSSPKYSGDVLPGFRITEQGLRSLTILDSLSGVNKKRLRFGVWAGAEGTIYDNFDRRIHVISRNRLPKCHRRSEVVDFGYTLPFVWQNWHIDHDGRIYVVQEIYFTRRLVEDHCRRIKMATASPYTNFSPEKVICDTDAEDRATFEKHRGCKTKGADKEVSPGIQAMQTALQVAGDGKPRFFYVEDALIERDQNLLDLYQPTSSIDEVDLYVWNEAKDAPVKLNDHGMDCWRYGAMEFFKPRRRRRMNRSYTFASTG